MIKINLETELLRQNKKIHSPSELLQIKEYDRLGDNLISNLENIFPNMPAKSGRIKKSLAISKSKKAENFNPDRIFHISQIEAICNKYVLRFLPTYYYAGFIDSELTKKVSEFEISHNIKLTSLHNGSYGCNSFIIAPASSFKLERKPKDPLLFYKINDDYYYLIHKWGNDLSIFRRLYSFFIKIFSSKLILPLAFFIATTLILWNNRHVDENIGFKVLSCFVGYMFGAIGFLLTGLINSCIHDDADDNNGGPYLRLVQKKEYNSSSL